MKSTTQPKIPAPLQFTCSAELNRDAASVFELLSTSEGMERWVPACKGVRWEHPQGPSGGALAVGSIRYVSVAAGIVAREDIVRVERPQRLHYQIVSAGFRVSRFLAHYEGVNVLTPLGDARCRLDWQIHFRCQSWCRGAEPLWRIALKPLISLMVDNVVRICGGRRVD